MSIIVCMAAKQYSRDKRSPTPVNEAASELMSKIKSKNTKPEILLRKMLWKKGYRGYRLHWNKVPGKPDIAYPGKKIAIFVNGCYWHRCPKCKPSMPKSNVEFWKNKFEKNVARDLRKKKELEVLGWKVFIIWECEIKSNKTELEIEHIFNS